MRSLDEIKELIRIVQETGIGEIEIQDGDYRIRIQGPAGQNPNIVVPQVLPIASPMPAPVLASTGQAMSAPVTSAAAQHTSEEDRDMKITSPIVGTYYDAPSPGSPPFVKVGDRVEPKQVLCIIESMKLMNEIEAEVAGTIVSKLVENGRPVEYGQTLFTIRPA
jgi:acetyl-CoA carboxylase biotin carboxyl carrier protein